MIRLGRVIRIHSNIIVVNDLKTDEKFDCVIKGNIKNKSNILVGDIVEFEEKYDKHIILKVSERKNFFVRPPVANIDKLIICLSLFNPSPDYLLLDKELIFCYKKGIKPVICLNKIDNIKVDNTLKKEIDYINLVYGKMGIDIVYTSAKDAVGINDLNKILENSISAFSGNSGVGKSSLTSLVIGKDVEVGEISLKNKKGKNTTKSVDLYEIKKNTYILDTPGFSSYELIDVYYKDLKMYYKDFLRYRCKYEDCNHIFEDECEIKKLVEEGKIDKNRYERYKYLYLELLEKDKRKYK